MGKFQKVNSPHWLSRLCLNLSLVCQIISVGFGKYAALSMPQFSPEAILGNGYYLLAIFCLILQSFFWPIALRGYSLTVAYFYMSLSYVAILTMSWLVFHESVSLFNIVGTLLILVGVNLVMGETGADRHA